MHTLTNSVPVAIGPNAALEPSTWIMEDSDAGHVLANSPGGSCQVRRWTPHDSLEHVSNPQRILVIRPGRFGDLVLLTPCLRAIKAKYPKTILAVATLAHYRDAILGLPYVDEFVPYPVKQDSIGQSIVVSLEVLLSLAGAEQTTHLTDIFAERLGIELPEASRKPDFFLSIDERDWAFNNYPNARKKRVAIQPKASSVARDYPRELWTDVIRRLHQEEWDVVLLGAPDELAFKGNPIPHVRNCTTDKLSFRQSAAVLSTANVFLGPDSSLIHVAGALGTPALGLFSTVPWQLRTTYCPTTFVIQGKEGCDVAPCFSAFTGVNQGAFPSIGPCAKTGRCEALASITPERIVAKLNSLV